MLSNTARVFQESTIGALGLARLGLGAPLALVVSNAAIAVGVCSTALTTVVLEYAIDSTGISAGMILRAPSAAWKGIAGLTGSNPFHIAIVFAGLVGGQAIFSTDGVTLTTINAPGAANVLAAAIAVQVGSTC